MARRTRSEIRTAAKRKQEKASDRVQKGKEKDRRVKGQEAHTKKRINKDVNAQTTSRTNTRYASS